jgi:hypothetical protein
MTRIGAAAAQQLQGSKRGNDAGSNAKMARKRTRTEREERRRDKEERAADNHDFSGFSLSQTPLGWQYGCFK